MLQFHNRLINYLFPKSNNSTMLFPAVYGIRALAIIFVILGAFNFAAIKGGALGYGVLFVVSGYLFTESILRNMQGDNKVNLNKFYKNRASKIFPSLIIMLLLFSILLAVFRRDLMPAFRSNVLPSILQFENWWAIVKADAITADANPLSHLWALSALVQISIVWSLILWVIAKYFTDERASIVVAAALALISFLLLVYFYTPDGGLRGVYGTDSRAFSFFIGAALACYTRNPRDRIWMYPVFMMDILGGVSLVGLILLFVFTGTSKIAYLGANLLVSIFTACILLSAFRPSSILSRVLGFAPFSILGKASYGIYLWHLPFIMLLRAETEAKWWAIAIAVILMCIAAVASARFIEDPIRRGLVADTYRIIDGTPRSTYEKQEYRRALKRVRVTLISLLALILISLVSIFFIGRNPSEEKPVEHSATTPSQEGEVEEEEEEDVPLPAGFADTNTLFIGDEYALNAHDSLIDSVPNITVDVAGSRYSTSAGPIFEAYANGGWEGRIVIISLSHEGELYNSLDDLRARMKDNQLLFVVNNRGSEWEQSNNSKISEFVNLNENTYSVDWYGASETHGEYFDENGALTEEGAKTYTELIKQTVEAVLNR